MYNIIKDYDTDMIQAKQNCTWEMYKKKRSLFKNGTSVEKKIAEPIYFWGKVAMSF